MCGSPASGSPVDGFTCKRSDAPLHRPGARTRDRALRHTRAPPVRGAASRRRKAARFARRGGDQRPGSGSARLRDLARRRARHGDQKTPRAASKGFVALGIASAVTHRSKRRLYGLKHLAPLREAAAPPRGALARPQPRPAEHGIARRCGRRKRGLRGPGARPVPLHSPALPPLERREFELGELDKWLDLADRAIRRAQRALELHAAALGPSAGPSDPCGA
jgi:hypothetical protein